MTAPREIEKLAATLWATDAVDLPIDAVADLVGGVRLPLSEGSPVEFYLPQARALLAAGYTLLRRDDVIEECARVADAEAAARDKAALVGYGDDSDRRMHRRNRESAKDVAAGIRALKGPDHG